MSLALEAMMFAREVHKTQRRKYTNNPYTDHLAEVAGIVATVDNSPESIAVAWLHDSREDQGVSGEEIESRFGMRVAVGVALLSDFETGNRAERKAASRARLADAPGWGGQTMTPRPGKGTVAAALNFTAEKRQLLTEAKA